MLGTTIEWYDFFIYGTAAALVFNRIFFPAFDPLTGTLAAFATYAVGFFARPLGGILFGHFGDRLGRKSMLLVTLLLMGLPTIAIGLIPGYDAIGYWAAICLVAMRVIQGIAVGGEWGGAVLMAIEHAPVNKRGFFGSLPQTGVAPGLILSSMGMAAVSALPERDMLSWGWRVPFLASVVLLIVGWIIRIKVEESPDFEAMKRRGNDVGMPLITVLHEHLGAVLKVAGARMAEVTWFYTVVTFALSYGTTTLGLPRSTMLNGVMWGAAVALLAMPATGILGDRFGHRRVFAIGCVLLCLFGFPFFAMLRLGHAYSVYLAMVIAIGVIYSVLYASEGALFSAQFPASVRYSGISLAVQVSGALGGGMAPMIATWLLKAAGGNPSLIATYLAFLGVVAITSTYLMKGTTSS
ncbi:MFS transporter [Paraburkholderia hospita]|uniref:MFS transporter n=1 Tax=Paraburkholderia hospita TaxID=169430 RepID=UPI000DEF3D87|nr:MFS transporter [Paraburkholderia hospita]AXF05901.1 MFS transporter [Paraburkholderia hospita]